MLVIRSSFDKLRQHVRGIKATGLVFGSSFEQSRQHVGRWAPSQVLGLALLVLDGCFISMVPPIYTSRQQGIAHMLSIRIVFRSSFKKSRQQAQGTKATRLVSRSSFDKSRKQR
ncbi:unnamed protein product [Lactuca saligna]|uniref:Uncharacterized protein n=1 Tax=Lactuca saligna TaxID=75948 RepID=A0AA35Z7D0_LACSI|nr:unnamed protein product [Lactuca saligna]